MMSTSTVFQKPISKTSQLTNDSGFINSDIVAPNYSDLTFPVAEGQYCIHEGGLYKANQAISTSESWTAAHWTETAIDEEFSLQLNAITNNATEEDLLRSEMPGTSTTVTTDSNGNPTSIVHTANSATVRTDTFVWGTGTVTETRTLANGKYITITTNLETLAQTISEVQEVA